MLFSVQGVLGHPQTPNSPPLPIYINDLSSQSSRDAARALPRRGRESCHPPYPTQMSGQDTALTGSSFGPVLVIISPSRPPLKRVISVTHVIFATDFRSLSCPCGQQNSLQLSGRLRDRTATHSFTLSAVAAGERGRAAADVCVARSRSVQWASCPTL